MHALYISVPRHGVNGITLHASETDAYTELINALEASDEGKAPIGDKEDVIAWCEDQGAELGVDWYVCEVTVPTES